MSGIEIYRNRIIERRLVGAGELRRNPANFRRHDAAQVAAVRALLAQVGIVAPIIAYYSERAGGALTLIDGELRESIGGQWPVDILDVSDAEADLILSAYDASTGLARIDAKALTRLMATIELEPAPAPELATLMDHIKAQIPSKKALPAPAPTGAEPAAKSILDRVIHQPALNKKRTLRFLSACRWHSATKAADVAYLHAFKSAGSFGAVPALMAQEMAQIVLDLGLTCDWITTPPKSHLERPAHLGTALAQALAVELGIEFVGVFADRPRASKSHPRHYDRRGDLEICAELPPGPALLVDDVATSATTLETCSQMLRQQGVKTMSFAYLYEDGAAAPAPTE